MPTRENGSGFRSERLATRTFVAAFILVALALPFASGPVALGWCYKYFVGPPLDFDAPHNGQVVIHIDVLGKVPPDIARIRVSEVATRATVWDVKSRTPRAECWNRCWNLTLKVGPNPASFNAGRQRFDPAVPQGSSFSLMPGTRYLFEVWDSRGRVERERFTL